MWSKASNAENIHLDALDYVKYANVYMEEIGT
jgi:hypothetical protein